MSLETDRLPEYLALGVRVHAIDREQAIAEMQKRIRSGGRGSYVALAGMHALGEARKDPQFRDVLNKAFLAVPDGMPLVWLARFHRIPLSQRVSGSELMCEFCETTAGKFRHFFYGGAAGVAEELAANLAARYGIVIAGMYSPPFRPLQPEEVVQLQQRISESSPDILWVGLGAPKQEKWMAEFGPQLGVPLMVGVGAAFDMNTGRLSRAPQWMQASGLEWLYRLLQDPGRLWKRYLITIPEAAWAIALEMMGLKKFREADRAMKTP